MFLIFFMGIFFFIAISALELCMGTSARFLKSGGSPLVFLNFGKVSYRYHGYLNNAPRFFKKINFFKKKSGFFLFFKSDLSARALLLNLCFSYFYISRVPLMFFIESVLRKKISREALVFFFLQIGILEKKDHCSGFVINFIDLAKVSDFFFFNRALLQKRISKITSCAVKETISSKLALEKNSNTQKLETLACKYNGVLSSTSHSLENQNTSIEYLFLLNSFFSVSKKFFFLRDNKLYNKSRYSRNRQTYRTGVFWCIWLTVLTVIGLYFYFYVFLIKFTYAWIFFFFFIMSFFFYYFRSKIERHFFF